MKKTKEYLTTGEAATIFNVDPDSVLRWIKSGDLPAVRTPGGHYRIHKNVFLTKLTQEKINECNPENHFSLSYCWEFNSQSGKIRSECKNCIVFKSRTAKCYELSKLAEEIGHQKLFCTESCTDCRYFKIIPQSAN